MRSVENFKLVVSHASSAANKYQIDASTILTVGSYLPEKQRVIESIETIAICFNGVDKREIANTVDVFRSLPKSQRKLENIMGVIAFIKENLKIGYIKDSPIFFRRL